MSPTEAHALAARGAPGAGRAPRRQRNVAGPPERFSTSREGSRSLGRALEKRHRYVYKKPTQILRLAVEDMNGHRLRSEPYKLWIDGELSTGTTDGDGIVMTGDKPAVFDGICGAESGAVPVAAVAPAMLFSEIEVQKRGHSLNRQPILPPPDASSSGGGKGGL